MQDLIKNTKSTDFPVNKKIQKARGIKFVERKRINLDDILIDNSNNPARYGGFSPWLVNSLSDSFVSGIRYDQNLPILELLEAVIPGSATNDGMKKVYRPVDGYNRITALKGLGVTEYWFDIVHADNLESKVLFALDCNDHAPSKRSNEADIQHSMELLVRDGVINNDFDDIRDYINNHCYVSNTLATRIANKVATATAANRSFALWSATDIKKGLVRLKIYSHGVLDALRGKHGYTCLEGYERDTIFGAISKYAEFGNESYIHGHVKSPTDKKDINDRREGMEVTFRNLEEDLIETVEFYNKYGRFPWTLEGFLPQDMINETPNEVVKLK